MNDNDRKYPPSIANAYDPLATGCLNTTCFAKFRAPADVKHGDRLTCPTCGGVTVVIDTGRDPTRVEYLRCKPAEKTT